MAVYQMKTFADLVTAIRAEIKIQSSDTTSIQRIKQDINIVYNELLGEEKWLWLQGHTSLAVQPYISTGTVALTQGSSLLTFTSAPSASQTGKLFSIDGSNDVYTIESHTAASTTAYLQEVYTGTTSSAANYKLWADKVPLPTDCKETINVFHSKISSPMDKVGIMEFRRITTAAPKVEGDPCYYFETDFIDPQPTSSITSMPSLSTRASAGVVKTLVFNSTLPSGLTNAFSSASTDYGKPLRIRVSGSAHPSYNGDYTVASASGTTLIYIGKSEYTESAVADTGLSVNFIDSENDYERYRALKVYPAISQYRTLLNVDYIKEAPPLENDADEPVIPLQDRSVLLYGALHRVWSRERNPEEATRNYTLYQQKLMKMAGKLADNFDKPMLLPSKRYLGAKRSSGSTRGLRNGYFNNGTGGGSSGAIVTGVASMVAVYDSSGEISSSSTVDSTELSYLNGVTSNIQTQLNTITTLADGKIYLGNTSNEAAEVTMTGDVTISNAGVTAISSGVIVNADVNASAAIALSKLATVTASRALESDSGGLITASAITATELSYLDDVEPLTTFAMSDNQAAAANVATWTAASFDSIFIEYSIKRGSANKECGNIILATDGTNASISQNTSSLGTIGVTFTADVSGGSLRLRYTSSSSGVAPTMKYKLNKWLA